MKMTDVQVEQWILDYMRNHPDEPLTGQKLYFRICQENPIPSVQIRFALGNLRDNNKIRVNKKLSYELVEA